MSRAGTEHRVVWHDNTAGRLPPDLAELFASVERVWERALGACTPVR